VDNTGANPDDTFTNLRGGPDYGMAGIPDGTGAYDNGDGTFTVLINHEHGNTVGVTRAHGSKGSFVSEWVIDKNTLAVIGGGDLITNVKLWNGVGYTTFNTASPMPNLGALTMVRLAASAPETCHQSAHFRMAHWEQRPASS
jgi:hypothetical protein